jgi:basic membrane lipoprotein Med (substrate-binding protein (PBP1-ABC) superfamily)
MVQIIGRDRVVTDYIPESITDVNFTIPSDQCKAAVSQYVTQGYKMIVAPALFSSCLQWAHATYSQMYFLLMGSLSTSASARNPRIAHGFPRMHEARYLTGLIAAAYTKTKKVGYVTASASSNPRTPTVLSRLPLRSYF